MTPSTVVRACGCFFFAIMYMCTRELEHTYTGDLVSLWCLCASALSGLSCAIRRRDITDFIICVGFPIVIVSTYTLTCTQDTPDTTTGIHTWECAGVAAAVYAAFAYAVIYN